MADNVSALERRAMNKRGLWVHWIGDAVSLIVLLVTLVYNNGKMDERVKNVESAQAEAKTQADRGRVELKADMQREFATMADTLRSLDTKLTTVLMQRR